MKSISSHEYDIFRRCMIAARKEAQLTQESLAKSLQKPQSFVAKYENGERRLDVVEFLIVTRVIGVDPCTLLRKVEQEIKQSISREKTMNTSDVIRLASQYLAHLLGHKFDVLDVSKPVTVNAAVNLAKVISKLSPLVGNLIEFNTVEFLNKQDDFAEFGAWERQDPGFPDTIFVGDIQPTPGLEIKAWFPLATEITARFKDSQNHFQFDQTHVAMLAWLPEKIIYGKPRILDVCVVSGLSVALARDSHYHNPPDYLVLEPEDTTQRTANLQQTNTSGYKFQGSADELLEAQKRVYSWGTEAKVYKPTREYQQLIRELLIRYKYRLDTNFGKMDRIVHPGIEEFKKRVYNIEVHGMTVGEWNKLLSSRQEDRIKESLQKYLEIKEESIDELLD
ncbi:MAG: helix-turn-helix transcriptional regulator [Nostocales cyanobacterium 94392]|nr:helix-turn-helix transcriptional regulator [Nostocales cyanobacterium 94392]